MTPYVSGASIGQFSAISQAYEPVFLELPAPGRESMFVSMRNCYLWPEPSDVEIHWVWEERGRGNSLKVGMIVAKRECSFLFETQNFCARPDSVSSTLPFIRQTNLLISEVTGSAISIFWFFLLSDHYRMEWRSNGDVYLHIRSDLEG